MTKPKSEAWYAAMHARKGKGTNQYTKAKELGLPKPEVSVESHLKRSISNKRPHTEETKKKLRIISNTCINVILDANRTSFRKICLEK